MQQTTSAPWRQALKTVLALLLCLACVPAQSLAFAKQAWADPGDEVAFYAVYYTTDGGNSLTLVFQSNSEEDPQYGAIHYVIPVGPGQINDVGLSRVEASTFTDSDNPPNITRDKEIELAPLVEHVIVRDRVNAGYSMLGWFGSMRKCVSFDLKNLDTSNVTNTARMFWHCDAVTVIDLSPCDLSKVESAGEMFYGCKSLEKVEKLSIGNLNRDACTISLCREAERMFMNCTSLKTVDLSSFQTSGNCSTFTQMFYGCSSLENVDFSQLKLSASATRFNYAFDGCASLKSIRMPSGNTGLDRTAFNSAFRGCSSLKELDLSGINLLGETGVDGMLKDCTSLQTLRWFSDKGNYGTGAPGLSSCTSLRELHTANDYLAEGLPAIDKKAVAGATGSWVYLDGSYVPELSIQPGWITAIPDASYTGAAINPAVYVVDQNTGKYLTPKKDYEVKYAGNINPGVATATVTGLGRYTGQAQKTFAIVKTSGGSNSSGSNPAKPSGGDPATGGSTGGNSGTQSGTKPGGSSGSSNGSSSSAASNPGSSAATTAPPLSGITVGGAGAGGASLPTAAAGTRPPVSIVVGGKKLVEGVDFTVRRVGGDKVGEAYLVLTGTGLSKWTRTVKYIVLPAGTAVKKTTLGKKSTKLAWRKQASQTDGYQVRYSTKKSMKGAKTKTVKGAKKTSAKLPRVKAGKSLYVQVRTYKKVGGKTYYSPWSAKTRISNPPATSVSKLKKAKRGFTVKWKKQPKKWTTGYQVRWSTKKSMKGAKKLTVKGASKTSAKVSKLKSGKKYYVQVRSYKKVGKKTYYSPWSKAKTVKTKK